MSRGPDEVTALLKAMLEADDEMAELSAEGASSSSSVYEGRWGADVWSQRLLRSASLRDVLPGPVCVYICHNIKF